jgi:PPOX class probable F420-dependent enzyme
MSSQGVDADAGLRLDEVMWLTTVNPSGQPQSSPVWFHWNGDDILLLSQPRAAKLTNIGHHPAVSVHLNGGDAGSTVVSIEATASVAEVVDAARLDRYVEKYQEAMHRIGTAADTYLADFSVAIVARPRRTRRFPSL